MGLKISTLDRLPSKSDREYFVYFLDYGWNDEFTKVLYDNFDPMAASLAGIDGVVIQGIDRQHFADEVLSWHQINGEDTSSLLPAILVTSKHPNEFRDGRREDERWAREDVGLRRYDGAVLIPLREVCATPDDVIPVIGRILQGIKEDRAIADFEVVGIVGEPTRAGDIFLLQPNFQGVGVDLKELWKRGRDYLRDIGRERR